MHEYMYITSIYVSVSGVCVLVSLAMSLCSSDGCPTGHLLQKGTGHHQKVSTARAAGRENDECSATQDEIISQHTYTHTNSL